MLSQSLQNRDVSGVFFFKASAAGYLLFSDNNKSLLMKSGDSSVQEGGSKVQREELREAEVQLDPGY